MLVLGPAYPRFARVDDHNDDLNDDGSWVGWV